MAQPFALDFTAEARHIDMMGHVNNTVWVEWVQDLATAHWEAVAGPDLQRQFIWLVIRHEIDYRGNIAERESVTGTTWVPSLGTPPVAKGAKCPRRAEFRNAAGKVIVSALTTWAMLDRETGRLARVRPEMIRPFMAEIGET